MSEMATLPSPDGVPFFGHGFAFSRDPFGSLEAWATHGDVVRLSFPGQTFHMVTDPELIGEMLMNTGPGGSFSIGPAQREAFEGLEDEALTANIGERWRTLRTALQPAFTRETIQRYGDRMVEEAASWIDERENGEELDLHREMRLLTLGVLSGTLLGADVDGAEEVVLGAADATIDRGDIRRPGNLLPDWVPTPTERRFQRSVRKLQEFVEERIEERQAQAEGDDVASVLLAAHERGELTREEVKDNMVAILLGGHDTTAVTLTYALYLLSEHPEVRRELVEEYEEVVGSEQDEEVVGAEQDEEVVGNGLPGVGAFDDLERTRNVISETLRLYPPAFTANRQATESVTLGEYEFPEGTQFLMPQWVLHRDERFWKDPERFDPSRWSRETDRPEYAYFPFSGGPRHCIGMQFARLELALVLSTLVGHLELDVSVAEPLTFTPSLTLRPEVEMLATVQRRD